jgi:hypothetical protein
LLRRWRLRLLFALMLWKILVSMVIVLILEKDFEVLILEQQ